MQQFQYTLFPLIQIIPQENTRSFWNIYCEKDLRIVASVNYFARAYCPDTIMVFDMNRMPATKMISEKYNIELVEYYIDNPNELAKAIIQLVRKDPIIKLIILHYFAPKIGLISNILVSAGFEVLDERRKYPFLYEPGNSKKLKNYRIEAINGNCPECDSNAGVYQEGVFVCDECGFGMEE